MLTKSIYVDYDPNFGIENPDQIYQLTVPLKIQKLLVKTINDNLNKEIENNSPKYSNILVILVGIIFFMMALYLKFLGYFFNLVVGTISIILVVLNVYMVMTTLPLKERLIPFFLNKVKINTFHTISIKPRFEYRVKIIDVRNRKIFDDFQTLVGFRFRVNTKILAKYMKKNEQKSDSLLMEELSLIHI